MQEGAFTFIRMDPPGKVRVRPLGGDGPASAERALGVVGIHSRGLLLASENEAPEPGTRVAVRLEAPAGEVAAEALCERAPEGTVLHLGPLDEPARGRLENLITRNRKADHIRITTEEDVGCEGISTGFERYRLPHEALPELSLREVDTRTRLFAKPLAAPLLISCMTGGSELAKAVNRRLATVAERLGIGLGLGSQRAMLQAPELADTYAVRDLAPSVLLIANLGAVQLNHGVTLADCEQVVASVGADALALHLNPLQEAVQPEGDVDFRGLQAKIAELAASLSVPLILKEVGSGLSSALARWAATTAVAALDTAGAGGTSWAKVESYRARAESSRELGRAFAGWGIPTAESLVQCRRHFGDRPVIASGGMRTGIEVAKAVALGADAVGIARPFIEAAVRSEEAVRETAARIIEELRVAMFCAGVGSLEELRRVQVEREEGS